MALLWQHMGHGLPEPTGEADEVTMHRDAFHGIRCQQFVDENLAKLTSSEQQPIFDTVVEAVEKKTPLCVFVQGRAGYGKTLLMSVITAELQRRGHIVLCTATTGIAASGLYILRA